MRPTRTTGNKSMKKVKLNGFVSIKSDREEKFINMNAAIQAAQSMQLNMTLQGYLTTSYFNLESQTLEVTVHFSDKVFPTIYPGYKSTWHEVSSDTYWNEYAKKTSRVRTLRFHFEY